MALTETGSKAFSTNKKDWVFLLKLAGLAAVAGVVGVGMEEIDTVKSLVPVKFAPLVPVLLVPLMAWVMQWLTDAREKVKDEVETPPLPPMTIWLMVLALSLPTLASAQMVAYQGYSDEPKVVFKPYSLIRLSCVEQGTSFVWIVRRLPDGLRPDSVRLESGKELVWTGPPGNYDIDTIYTDKAGTLQQLFSRIVIENLDPVTPPEPGPGPKPPVPTPPGPSVVTPLPKPTGDKFGFGGITYDLCLKIEVKDRLLAEKIADNYGSVSAAIFAGGIVDVNKAFEELRNRNRELTGEASFSAWNDWFEKLGFQVQENWNNRKFSTRSDIAEVFREIQIGLLASIGKKPE